MIEKFKHNTKIKLISLLSSIVLWMYVMAIVDPQETRVYEDINITIKNMSELNDKDLMIYPDVELTSDISLSGKLSSLKKIDRDNIHISGEINNPIEGKNQIYLSASTPGQVSHDIKNDIMIVNLEKLVTDEKKIDIQIEGTSKYNVDQVIRENDQQSVSISGPRTLVNEVEKVVGVLDVGSNKDGFTSYINLLPVDKDGNEVEDVKLEQQSIKVSVTFLQEKNVPIKIKIKDDANQEIELNEFKPKSVNIKGKKEVIDAIEFIETEVIDINNIGDATSKDVYLNIPQGVTSDIKYITIELDTIKTIKESFTYTSEEVEIRNNVENIDVSTISIPSEITVDIEYQESVGTINKSDIVLYIDLSEELGEGEKYSIKYETQYETNKITIQPDKIL